MAEVESCSPQGGGSEISELSSTNYNFHEMTIDVESGIKPWMWPMEDADLMEEGCGPWEMLTSWRKGVAHGR